MAEGVVDTLMAGRLSATALGAVGLGAGIYYTFSVFGIGLLLGLDTLISRAYGAKDLKECQHWLISGVWLAILMAPVLMGGVWLIVPLMDSFGVNPAVRQETIPYLKAMAWGTLPLMLYSAFRRFLQSLNIVAPVMFALVTTNLVNVFFNWVLMFGKFGAPALGAEGLGWATTLSRVYLAIFLGITILYYDRRHHVRIRELSLRLHPARLREVSRLGFPAATQITFEVGVFAVVTTLIARLDPSQLAAHQITLNIASVTYMVPLGISSAAAVRVGHGLGSLDPGAAARAGWVAIGLGASFMFVAALSLWLIPAAIARLFTPDVNVIRIAAGLLAIAAFFQLFDGIQAVATGALRGAGDTRTAMLTHITCYWLIGLPLGYALAFPAGWGAAGLWIGLSTALILIGMVLLLAWTRVVQSWRSR